MKNKILLSTVASLFLANSSVFADTSAVETALKNTKTYDITGEFSQYDFADKDNAFDWVFKMNMNSKIYQLQGNNPTDSNLFGWKEVSVSPEKANYYMASMGDWDKDGKTKFDWLVLSTDGQNIYKLEGVADNGTFKYSAKLDIKAVINSDKTSFSIEGLTDEEVLSGIVDLDGLGLPGEDTNADSTTDDEEVLLPGVTPDNATIQVYDVDDTEFENPLLKEAVETKDDGTYNINNEHFISLPGQDDNFIIRVVAEKDNQNYEMSAVVVDRDEKVKINPVTTAVRTQITDTIKSMFGEKFDVTEDIKSAISTLTKAIVTKVEKDIKDKKITLQTSDFITTKQLKDIDKKMENDEIKKLKEQNDKLKLKLKESEIDDSLAIFETELESIKFDDMDMSKIDLNTDSGSKDINTAQIEYKTIANFAKMGLSVHNGEGDIIVFLPVPSEEFDKLPGEEFNIETSSETVGYDPALRKINIARDLSNATGYEMWAMELVDSLIESPIVPYNVIKSMIKNRDNEVDLDKFGEYLLSAKHPFTGANLFDKNPTENLIGLQLNNNPKESAKQIVAKYRRALIKDNLDWMLFDSFDKAMRNGKIENFLNVFGVNDGETETDFVNRLANLPEFDHVINDISSKLAQTLPNKKLKNASDNLMRFDNYVVTKDSTITPRTGIALMDLLMTTANFENSKLTPVAFNEVFGFMKDETNKDKKIWFVEFDDAIEQSDEIKDINSWMRDFIIGVSNTLTGEKIKAEVSFRNVERDIKKYAQNFAKKVEENMGQDFIDDELMFNTDEIITTTVTFNITDIDQNLTDVKEISFIPIFENIETHERFSIDSKTINVKPFESRVKEQFKVYPPSIRFNENGEEDSNGNLIRTLDYDIIAILPDDKMVPIGIRPIFPEEINNLGDMVADSNFVKDFIDGNFENDNSEMDHNFQVLSNEHSTLFAPMLDKDILEFSDMSLTSLNDTKIKILAVDIEASDQVWQTDNFNTDETVTAKNSIKLGSDVKEGGILLIDDDIIAIIEFIEEDGKVGIALMKKPRSDFKFTEAGAPVCFDGEKDVELPPRDDGSYPFFDDADFPQECKNFIPEMQRPECFDGEKDIELPEREDGTFPFPGDPDFPKGCLTNFEQPLIMTDCQGKEFDKNEDGAYVLPHEESFSTESFSLECMQHDYFNEDFKDSFQDKFMQPEQDDFMNHQPHQAPECFDKDDNKVDVPMNDETGQYAMPNDGVWETVCADKYINDNNDQQSKDIADTVKDLF